MTVPTHRDAARGFTLMELLVAIMLVTALIGSMFAFLTDIVSSRTRLGERVARQRAATMLLDRVEADLASCFVGDHALGAGVAGDETNLRILTHGVGIWPGAGAGGFLGDLQMAEYRFDAPRGAIEAGRGPVTTAAPEPGAESTRSAPGSAPSRSASISASSPILAALGGVIGKVRFRYHDGAAWQDSFDSLDCGRLPAAVEVAVWFNPWPGDDAPQPQETPSAPNDEEETRAPLLRPTFDEEAYARLGNRGLRDEPRPDRVRVIVIPDCGPDDQPAETAEAAPSASSAPSTGGAS